MYSDENRAHYVERMWEEGLTPTEAERLWGLPSRRSLAQWQRDALEGRLEVRARRPPHACGYRRHARYPEETRGEALRLLGLGKPTRQIARMLGLRDGRVVSEWARKERLRAGGATMGAEAVDVEKATGGEGDELERLRVEVAVLREMLSDPKAGDPARLSNRRKAELGERLRGDYGFPLARVLTCLGISKSSYEYARRALARARAAPADGLAGRVARAFAFLGGRCGYRKVCACIRSGADGEPPAPAPERRVRAAMREGGMRARRGRRPARYSSYAGEVGGARPANVPRERALARREAGEPFRLAHDFSADAPGKLLVTDVTEFSLNGFRAYLSPVIDCWDGCPVGVAVSLRPDQELCSSSLDMALASLPAGSAPVVHTDGGACYRGGRWRAQCERAGATRSMSRKGTCPDNARAEGFFGTLKQEFFYGREWAGVSPGAFEAELLAYVGWYVRGRPRLFREGGRSFYETLADHRRRLGVPVPTLEVG